MLSLIKYIAVILLISSACNVPRLSHPTYDDVAGAPMAEGMIRYIHEGEESKSVCKHFYVQEALPSTDMWVSSVRCICVFCKSIIVREE